jgi:hypothetical protein
MRFNTDGRGLIRLRCWCIQLFPLEATPEAVRERDLAAAGKLSVVNFS